jgi:hypothetical protein
MTASRGSIMSRELLANGKPIKRSQLRAMRRTGAKLRIGFGRTDPRTDKIIR